MRRRQAMAFMVSAALPRAPSAAVPGTLLTVSGQVGLTNNAGAGSFEFTEAQFLALPQSSITTSTPWTPISRFVGPTVLDVMAAVGVTKGTLTFSALDDYAAPIPWDDLERYGVILAHSQDGERLSTRRWGPLWTIYPRDRYPDALKGPTAESRFIWQVNLIEVSR